jgi:phosphocarrier protein
MKNYVPYTVRRMDMTRDITITNALGMNANNSPLLVQRANTFKSSIWIQTEERQVNAKSLLGVISLGIKKGMTVTLIAEGADENEALDGLCDLITNGFNQ